MRRRTVQPPPHVYKPHITYKLFAGTRPRTRAPSASTYCYYGRESVYISGNPRVDGHARDLHQLRHRSDAIFTEPTSSTPRAGTLLHQHQAASQLRHQPRSALHRAKLQRPEQLRQAVGLHQDLRRVLHRQVYVNMHGLHRHPRQHCRRRLRHKNPAAAAEPLPPPHYDKNPPPPQTHCRRRTTIKPAAAL
ncbi:hypothetical protein QYE76_020572 [Lolium multiflorum]|uniref:Uncharacterized protein n=1 Tax=Lolium multiflorum TaxID=4521 RepID=A0AAD8R6H8_LOLMU|nr:hypothetical protein QYE76_020572 [Lolium multiflorum]